MFLRCILKNNVTLHSLKRNKLSTFESKVVKSGKVLFIFTHY